MTVDELTIEINQPIIILSAGRWVCKPERNRNPSLGISKPRGLKLKANGRALKITWILAIGTLCRGLHLLSITFVYVVIFRRVLLSLSIWAVCFDMVKSTMTLLWRIRYDSWFVFAICAWLCPAGYKALSRSYKLLFSTPSETPGLKWLKIRLWCILCFSSSNYSQVQRYYIATLVFFCVLCFIMVFQRPRGHAKWIRRWCMGSRHVPSWVHIDNNVPTVRKGKYRIEYKYQLKIFNTLW